MEAILHKNFQKQLFRLPVKIQDKVFERIDLFCLNIFNPVLNNHSVDSAYPGCRSINITGDYGTIYYQSSTDSATFVEIGRHAELYG